ncbi:PREDICTED: single myb histone 4-like [Ipomoea nil]|uniref:single myb histone 4-like n=1 Tax=Ipomoea nil TaxID=35883 RepID=UPI00090130DF|nr:PREDICTED: single myb histone 4-like [Ipomoea nil]
MGNPKQKWTSEEEEALRAGVAKHGAGKWKNIQRDPEFNHLLHSRSNIDLKDKWRNLKASANAQGSRDKSKSQKPKPKANADVPMTPVPNALTHASSTPFLRDTSTPEDGKTASKYNGMIYEALTNLKDPSGCDIGTIVNFIEQRHEVPPNSRRLLSSRLRRLVQQDKLEKIHNCFRIKKEFLRASSTTPTPKIKDLQNSGYLGDTVEEVAIAAAYMIAEAENKSFVAAEAVKEAERVSRMTEDSDVLLQLAKDIYDKCARGEIVLLA